MTGCSLFPGATWTPLHPPSWIQKGMEVSLALPPAPCETGQVIRASQGLSFLLWKVSKQVGAD